MSRAALQGLLLVLCACATGGRPKGGLAPLEGISPEQVREALRPKRLALLVGINLFSDDRWPSLRHALADASALGELLKNPDRGHFDDVEVLADPSGTTLNQIRDALDRLATKNQSSEDTVLVYFSTHGTLARAEGENLSRFLVTSDTNQDRIHESALQVRELSQSFEQLRSKRKVLILASCHSGSGKSALPNAISTELRGVKGAFFVQPLQEMSQASMVLTACAWGETAREDDTLGHDIYTAFFIESLEKGDQDRDGAVSASEAHVQAMEKTYYFSKGRQRPQVESSILGADPILLAGERVRTADPVLFSFSGQWEGMRFFVDGREKGALPNRFVVEPGSHRISLRDNHQDSSLLEKDVTLEPGEELSIDGLLEARSRTWQLELRGGYQTFLDREIREKYIKPLALIGIGLRWFDFPLKNTELGFDLSIGGGRQTLDNFGTAVFQNLTQLAFGMHWAYRFNWDHTSLVVGPRASGLYMSRIIKGDSQPIFNIAPGLLARFQWSLWSGLSLSIESRIHVFYAFIKDKFRGDKYLNLTYFEAVSGLGWSF